MGILILAILSGAIAAIAALVMGQPFLIALALYAGCGLVGAGIGVAVVLRAPQRAEQRAPVPQPSPN